MSSHTRERLTALILGSMAAVLSFPVFAEDGTIAIPEPGIMALLLGGVGAGVLLWRNRRK